MTTDDVVAGTEGRTRFEREARAQAALSSPQIATLYGVERLDGDDLVLVLELVDGRTLADLLREGTLGVDQALDLFRQLATGLAAAHAVGVVHRDLKPGNLMVRPDGSLVILDFGLALLRGGERQCATEDDDRLTREGMIVGTPAYMAPEQVRGDVLGPAVDVWAAGAILYEMLTGRLPFKGSSGADRMAAVLLQEPLPISELRADLSAGVRSLIATCLSKEAARRPAKRRRASAARSRAACTADGLWSSSVQPGGDCAWLGPPRALPPARGSRDGCSCRRNRAVAGGGAGWLGDGCQAVGTHRDQLPRGFGASRARSGSTRGSLSLPLAINMQTNTPRSRTCGCGCRPSRC